MKSAIRRLQARLAEIPALSTLGEMILEAEEWDTYFTCIIYGWQGSGKTTYALKTAAAIYEDWWVALDHLFFFPKRALAALRQANARGERIPVLILDDAGTWLSKYIFFTREGRRLIEVIDGLLNMARSTCRCVVFTTVYKEDLPRCVREKARVLVEMRRVDQSYALARIEVYNIHHRVETIFQDRVKLEWPKPIKDEYDERRRRALARLIARMEQALAELGVDEV